MTPLTPVYALLVGAMLMLFASARARQWAKATVLEALSEASQKARGEIVKWAGVTVVGVVGTLTAGEVALNIVETWGPTSRRPMQVVDIRDTGLPIGEANARSGGGVVVGYGTGTGGGAVSVVSPPDTPSVTLATYDGTGTTVRVVSSPFSGDGALDSVGFQVDTTGGDFSSPKYLNVTGATLLADTATAVDSGAIVVGRVRHKNSAGWSAWSDTVRMRAAGPFEPAGMTVIYNNRADTALANNGFASEGWNVKNTQDFDSTRLFLKTGEYNPLGVPNVIRLRSPEIVAGNITEGSLEILTWDSLTGVSIGNVDTLYVRYRVKWNGFEVAGKPFYTGLSLAADSTNLQSNTDFYLAMDINGGIGFQEQGSDRPADKVLGGFFHDSACQRPLQTLTSNWKNVWHTIEIKQIAETTPGAKDGRLVGYVNGDSAYACDADSPSFDANDSINAAYWSSTNGTESSFNGFEWVFHINQSGTPYSDSMVVDFGELYISGKQ